MNTTSKLTISPLSILTVLFACVCLCAQELRMGMDPAPYYKGSPFRFQLVLENQTPDQPPTLNPSDDFTVEAQPPQSRSNSSISIINGRRSESKSTTTFYTFLLTPLKTGTLQMPGGSVVIDGVKKTIPPRTITVRALETNQTVTLAAELNKTTCAIGEPLTLRFTWTSTANIQNYDLTLPVMDLDNADVSPVPLTERQQNLRGATALSTTGGARIPAMQYANGQQIRIVFSLTVIPRKAGTVTLPAATITCDVIDTSSPRRSQRRTPFFNDPFFDDSIFGQQYNTKKCAAEAPAITLTVIEPPTANRPWSYTGLAEPCTISVAADRTDVYAGDPIVLSITLKGPAALSKIILPKLSACPEFQNLFRVFDNDAPGQLNPDNSITFKRTVRATSTDVTEIPPVEIAWFDAKDGQYHTSASQPIPLTVKATKRATAIAAELPATETEKVDITAITTGPKGQFSPEECLHNQNQLSHAMPFPWDICVIAALPLLTLLLAAVRCYSRHRASHADSYRIKGAAHHALQVLSEKNGGSPYQHALDAVGTFVGDKLKRPSSAITLQDMEQFLSGAGIGEDLLARTRNLVAICEAAIYAHRQDMPEDQLLPMAKDLILELDKATRHSVN